MRPRRPVPASVALVALVAVLAGPLAACSSSGPVIRYAGPSSPCAPRSGERTGNALVRCSEHSVVYVETEEASGTGVAFERDGKRYILTNCHVVDPYAAVAITLDGKRHADIPVIGVDAAADIAVLGPLPSSLPTTPVAVGVARLPERGDEVFLVGYPGEAPPDDPEDLETTIAGGIVSRIRPVKAFDQTYVQTDASIAGGQSGGPLFDDRGDLLGISGLGFADEFALALSSDDVERAVERILKGDGDDYPAVPIHATDDMVTSGAVELTDAVDDQVLFVPADDGDRTLKFALVDPPADVVVRIATPSGEYPLAVSGTVDDVYGRLDDLIAAAGGEVPSFQDDPSVDPSTDPTLDDGSEAPDEPTAEELAIRAAEVGPNSFEVTVPDGESVQITVSAPLAGGPTKVGFTSSLAVHPLTRARDVGSIEVGGSADHVLTRFDGGVDYLLDLDDGQEVQVSALSAQSDVGFTVFGPEVTLDPVVLNAPFDADGVTEVDDSGEGLYGLDAVGVIGGAAGTYRIRIYSNEYLTVLARLQIRDCEVVSCPKER